ncbi:MFS transporter [Muriicola marianensis]|uniref:MFS transporter n=1 Tax=Muriicola marianensis TaxID=1324801 RepID=A0ABQ1QRF0_9FLAO|nr:MFS transporter [Muriicola marianensis]GGD39989.1 MFS transporter [Muriicola marianensis]
MKYSRPPWYFLALLILAGESVFILPFVLARVFRPTVLDTFELTNVELGLCFSVYGFVALFAYLAGGPLADRYPPRKLIAIALWTTALGGILFASFPSYEVLKILYGYWGVTTIFLFWAPMIKATRVWGGEASQGKAFGFLDGGRGLVGALFGSMGVYIFSFFIPADDMLLTLEESRNAFSNVILYSSGTVALVGVLVWFFLRIDQDRQKSIILERITPTQIREVMRLPAVWLLMVIILCAYVGYKITDVFSLYARDVMNYTQVESAGIGTFLLYIRPAVGVAIGVIADRSRTTLWLLLGFVIAFLGAVLFATGAVPGTSTFLFVLSIIVVATGVYAARSLYFAVMDLGKIPLALTGTAVGLISLVGFTPDIFAGPAMGYLLDRSPGVSGHRDVFWMLAVFSALGGGVAFYYHRVFGKTLPQRRL